MPSDCCPGNIIARRYVPTELWERLQLPDLDHIALGPFLILATVWGVTIYGTPQRPERPFRSGSGWIYGHPDVPYYELTLFWPDQEPDPVWAIILVSTPPIEQEDTVLPNLGQPTQPKPTGEPVYDVADLLRWARAFDITIQSGEKYRGFWVRVQKTEHSYPVEANAKTAEELGRVLHELLEG